MSRRGRTPERGGEAHAWTFDHCRDGKPRTGYAAGPLHWLLAHDGKPTKPCIVPLYGAGTSCEFCRAKIPLYECGYQPLRDMRGRCWVVLIRDTHERVVSRIAGGQGVRWGREEGVGEACYVEPWPVTPDWHYWYPDLKPEADLSRWLCRLWGMPELAAALVAHFAGGDKGLSQASADGPAADDMPADAPAELVRIAREQRAARAARTPPAESVADLVNRIPGMNGVHRPHE